jgi:hypothetical protein
MLVPHTRDEQAGEIGNRENQGLRIKSSFLLNNASGLVDSSDLIRSP